MDENIVTYDGTFSGNILMIGKADCSKTSFLQSFGRDKIFGNVDSVDWISKVVLSENREHQIRGSFSYASVEFHYSNDVVEFDTVLDLLNDNKSDVNAENNKDFDEFEGVEKNDVCDRLIFMDDVSGLVDKLNEFCSF